MDEHEEWNDEMLLGAILYKGGVVRDQNKCVIYPEDIEPIIGKENPYYEAEYWEKIKEQGRVWVETGFVEESQLKESHED